MRTPLTSPTASAVGPYSHGIDSGEVVYCSGQTPIDPETGELVVGGIAAQTNQCLDNLFAVLAAGGLVGNDVIKVNVYLTDMGDFAAMNEAYSSRFAEPFPARTTVGVAALPLASAIEIELIARRS